MSTPSTALETPQTDAPPAREIVISPRQGWDCLDTNELWAYRDLLYYLSWRNVAVRYKQTFFGVAWALVQPLVTSGILTLFFGVLAGIPSDGQPYFLFTFSAMLPWTLFREAVASSSLSLVSNAHLVTKVYFPRIMVPLSSMAVAAVDFFVCLIALIIIAAAYGVEFSSRVLLLAPLALAVFLCAFAVGIGLAAINVRFRDVRFTIPFLLQCWMFLTPVMYPSSMVPDRYRPLLGLNPLAGFVEAFRACLLGTPLDWGQLGVSSLVTLILLGLAITIFRTVERYFADVI